MGKIKKYPGIDLLRIIAAFLVVILHSLGHGGLLRYSVKGTASYNVLWLIEITAYSAVNIFIMISGFVSYPGKEGKISYRRIIRLWCETVFYGALIPVFFKVRNYTIFPWVSVISYFLPISCNTYWFFTSFAGLSLIKPVLDAGIKKLEDDQFRKMIWIMFAVFSITKTVTDPFVFYSGYSFIWFIILYCFGCYIKKLDVHKKISAKTCIAVIIISLVITWMWKINGKTLSYLNLRIDEDYFISYTSPTIILTAACSVIIFSKIGSMAPLTQKIITFLTPGVFAVYLLNDHNLIRQYFIKDLFAETASAPLPAILLRLFTFAFCFTTGAMVIDKIRQFLFVKAENFLQNRTKH